MKKLLLTLAIFLVATTALAEFGTERTYKNLRPMHHTETIADGENGATLQVPTTGRPITCTLIAGANTGKIQITTSSDAAVAAGTCTWIDWDYGDTTGTQPDVLTGPVTGIRGVSISGEVSIEIVY